MQTIDVQERYSPVTLTVTKSTPSFSAAPFTLGPDAFVDEVSILWAPGAVALFGVAINYGGNRILPWNLNSSFLFGDNERLVYKLGMYMPGPITLMGANNDVNSHTAILTFAWHTYIPTVANVLGNAVVTL